MKKTILALTVAGLMTTGCAEMQAHIPKMGGDHATGGAVSGAAIGAVAGNVITYALGGNRTMGTLAGAAIGGYLGYQQGKEADLAEAKKLADAMGAEKIPAKVQSYEYQVKDEQGAARKVSALKSIEAPLPADAIKARDMQLTGTLNKLGQFAATRTEPMIVTIAGTKKDIGYLKDSVAAGVSSAGANKAANVKIETVITKTPGALVTVQPVTTNQEA